MMEHTKEKIKQQRGLIMIILALSLVYIIEPGLHHAADTCFDLLRHMLAPQK